MSRAEACRSGDVAVQVKAGRKTVAKRSVRLTRTCTFRARVTPRAGTAARLTVRARFAGNTLLAPRAKTQTLRAR